MAQIGACDTNTTVDPSADNDGDPLGPPEQFFVGLASFTGGGDAWAPVAGGVINGAISSSAFKSLPQVPLSTDGISSPGVTALGNAATTR